LPIEMKVYPSATLHTFGVAVLEAMGAPRHEAMLVSESTIKTYLSRLYDKLGVNSRAQALSVAARAGLLGDDVPLSAR